MKPSQRSIFGEEIAGKLQKWALIDGPYRYSLGRAWGDPTERVCWVMLNPSTADDLVDDPTLRKCITFSRAWGFGALVVVNLFALRATDPRELRAHHAPIGPRNHEAILAGLHGARTVVAAWGRGGAYLNRGRDVLEILPEARHLGLTKDGHPKHPLYLPASTVALRWDR